MINFDTLVWFFFRFIDLGVMVAIGWYLMVHQLIPAIRSRMRQDALAHEKLEEQMASREAQAITRADELRAQEMHAQVLKQKLAIWAQAVTVREQELAKHFAHLQELQRERVATQQQALQHKQLVAQIVPHAYEQARKEIVAQFANQADAQAYLEHTFKALRERS